MKKLIIDVDECITGKNAFLESINAFLGTNYKAEDSGTYYMQDLLKERKEEYFNNFENYDFYKDMTLADDCYDVLEYLNKYYDINLCSAFVWREVPEKSGVNLKSKYEFLLRKLPFIDPNKIMFLTNKYMIDADIRIDDRIDNLGYADTNLLFTSYHNKDISDEELKSKNVIRVNNWIDVKNVLGNSIGREALKSIMKDKKLVEKLLKDCDKRIKEIDELEAKTTPEERKEKLENKDPILDGAMKEITEKLKKYE